MIEYIRKHSGLMIVVLGAVFISFFFMDNRAAQTTGSSPAVLKIDGRDYSQQEFQQIGSGGYQLVIGAAQAGDFGLYQAFGPLLGRAPDDAPKQLFIGRMLLREAQKDYGVYPGDDEISNYLKKMRLFSGTDNAFDEERYRNFIEKGLGRLGMTEKDLRELASDAIVGQKLQTIIGAGLAADRDTVARTLALDSQQISADLARLNLDDYQNKIDPTEEEIKAHWDVSQDLFKTETLRKFSYVIVKPAAVPEPAPTPEAVVDPAANEEMKAAAKKTEEEKKAAATAKVAEEKRAAQRLVDGLVDDFLFNLAEQKGIGFEDLARKNDWEVKTTGLFAQSSPPAELNVDVLASSGTGKVVDELFKMQITTDPFSKISKAVQLGDGQYLVAHFDAEEKPRVKTYAEARAEARGQYISEKGLEALKAATEEAMKKIKEAIASGKSFADAAKDAGITEVKTIEKIDSAYRPDAATEPQNLFQVVRTTDPGTIANTIIESDRSFIVNVIKREVVKEPNATERLDAEVKGRASESQLAAFDSWLTARIDAAKIEDLFTKR